MLEPCSSNSCSAAFRAGAERVLGVLGRKRRRGRMAARGGRERLHSARPQERLELVSGVGGEWREPWACEKRGCAAVLLS